MPHIALATSGIRYASDDWVRQAGTLRLDSPHAAEIQLRKAQLEQQGDSVCLLHSLGQQYMVLRLDTTDGHGHDYAATYLASVDT